MKYTLNIFLRNYKRDRKVFGEATKDIYEKFFELITENKVTINESAIYDDTLYENALTEDEAAEEIFTEWWFGSKKNPMIDDLESQRRAAEATERALRKEMRKISRLDSSKESTAREVARLQKELTSASKKAEEAEQAYNAAVGINNAAIADPTTVGLNPKDFGVDAITGKGMGDPEAVLDGATAAISDPIKPLGFFGKLKEKLASLFSGETSLGGFIKQGFAWLTNPENMSKVIMTGGGIATIIVLLNILRKKRKNKQYKMLQKNALNAIEKQKENLGEDFFEENEQILEELKKEYKIGYFNY